MGWLQKWDERNQGTANWLADHPEAGEKALPYANKTEQATLIDIEVELDQILC